MIDPRVNDGTTHWPGCEQNHLNCAVAQLLDARTEIAVLRSVVAAADALREAAHKQVAACSAIYDGRECEAAERVFDAARKEVKL